jgi:hypothetical protein
MHSPSNIYACGYSYLIEYDNKIIGVYNDYKLAEHFILSCLQNNLMNNSANILTYDINSCYKVKTNQVTLFKNNTSKKVVFMNDRPIKANNINLKSPTLESKSLKNNNESITPNNTPVIECPSINFLDPTLLDLANQKIELQHNINMLKVKKNKMDESKQVFETDLKLFELFKNKIEQEDKFEIPELFRDKFNIMSKLNAENKLDWENFVLEYKTVEPSYNDYFIPTPYDLKFEN